MSLAGTGVSLRILKNLSTCYTPATSNKNFSVILSRALYNITIASTSPESMKKVYVQHIRGNPMMTISFEYSANGKTKSFNLYRKADEPLSSALDRIKLNLVKLSKTKKSKNDLTNHDNKTEKVDLQIIQDSISLDPGSSRNEDAWIEGAIMKLNGDDYLVSRNEPQVAFIRLPSIIMSGFITLPSLDLANCDVHDCKFSWYRQISSQEREKLIADPNLSDKIVLVNSTYWLHLSTGLTYSPTSEDVAHHIKFVCHPANGTKIGPSYSCLSGRPVELGPTDCPFEKRHLMTQDNFEDCEKIRFVTYNILADLYADQEFSRKVLFAHCPAHALEIDYRRQLLLKEIHGYHADIVCLQEVDKKEFKRTYEPYFKLVTKHSGVFNTKGGEVAEGEATFFRDSRFELVDSHRTILSRLIDPTAKISSNEDASDEACTPELVLTDEKSSQNDPKLNQDKHPILDDQASQEAKDLLSTFEDMRLKMRKNPKLMKRFMNRHTILQTTLLRFKDMHNTYVIVANTHLYFAPDADHVRLLQGSVCTKYMEYMKGYYRRLIKSRLGEIDPKVSIIFCGDMNSSPDCGLFKLMHEGKVDNSLKDWHSNEEEVVESLTIESSLKFSSAYKNIPYTNCTPGFSGCLDYIYHELDGFDCESTIPLPDHDDVTATEGIPSTVFPSDHLALVANLKFKE